MSIAQNTSNKTLLKECADILDSLKVKIQQFSGM